jgi:flagellar protein FlaF
MGFSVSGAAAIIFASLFIAFGMWFTAAADGFERVSDAQDDRSDHVLGTTNTEVNITVATYDGVAEELQVEVDNVGAEQLSLEDTDLLIDGAYEVGWQTTASVAGNSDTDVWPPTKRLTVTVTGVTSQPDHVKLVTGTGVADTAEVTAP